MGPLCGAENFKNRTSYVRLLFPRPI